MLKVFSKYVFLLAFISLASSVWAQEAGVINSEKAEQTSVMDVGLGADAQFSPVTESSNEQELIAISPYTALAPGVCLVIGDMLADFCSSNPGDASCQFL